MAASLRAVTSDPLERLTDEQLITRFRLGDDAALGIALRRHEAALQRYARRILGTRSPNAEDVVQEAMLRTHLVVRRGDRSIDLKPWLFKLVRNCALDELARARAEVGPLSVVEDELSARGSDPAEISATRSKVRDTLADVAALGDVQRHALLRREVDGATHAEVAAELGISEPASRVLVSRARTNLTKARAGRDARCSDVRAELLAAHDAGHRASAHAFRHLAVCAPCREFRGALRRGRTDLRVLAPLPVLAGMALGAKAAGGLSLSGGSKAATATAVTAAVAGGALGIDRVFLAGDPAPVTVESLVVPGGRVDTGDPLPRGTAVVTRTVAPDPMEAVGRHVIECPDGLRVAGLAPTTSAASHALAPETIVGSSTRAVVLTERTSLSRLTLAIVCKRPRSDGSILAGPTQARSAMDGGQRAATVCVDRTYLRDAPRGRVVGSVARRQPVTVRAARDGWERIVADTGDVGWVRRSALCTR